MLILELFLFIIFVLIVAIIVLYYLYRKEHILRIKKSKLAWQMGTNQAKGNITQVAGTFGLLAEYDYLYTLSAVSSQGIVDLIGIKGDHLDFIEIKSPNAPLTAHEKYLKDIIESGDLKVSYKIVEVDLSKFTIKVR